MIDLAIIPARAGSVGLPGKNIIDLGGQPLIAWTIKAAVNSRVFNRIIVSTDGDDISQAALAAGAEVPFRRPRALATSAVGSVEVVLHALDTLDATGSFALLQPTSPFRTATHIIEASAIYQNQNALSLMSVNQGKPLSWTFRMNEHRELNSVVPHATMATRRQNEEPIVHPNGAIYIRHISHFRKTASFLPPETLGYKMGHIDSLDIDSADDYNLAQAILAAGLRKI